MPSMLMALGLIPLLSVGKSSSNNKKLKKLPKQIYTYAYIIIKKLNEWVRRRDTEQNEGSYRIRVKDGSS